jgi:hypothetical protein
MARDDLHPEGFCCGACEFAEEVSKRPLPVEQDSLPATISIPAAGTACYRVSVQEKGGAMKTWSFDQPGFTVGRVPGNDIVLPKGNVSKRTCQFLAEGQELAVVDLRSTCGTYVNGRRITRPTVLREGDKIYVGDFVLTISVGA